MITLFIENIYRIYNVIINYILCFAFKKYFIIKYFLNVILLLYKIIPDFIEFLFIYKVYNNNIILLPYLNKLQNLTYENNLVKFKKILNKKHNNIIIHCHGGAGILQFPVSFSYNIFKKYTKTHDLFYMSYELAQYSNYIENTIFTSCANIVTLLNKKYDKYIFIADSMGASIIYICFNYLFRNNILDINNYNIQLQFISPYIYYENINKNIDSKVDYLTKFHMDTLKKTSFYQNIPFIGNNDVNNIINIDDVSKEFVKSLNIKIYYSNTELLAPSIKKFCEEYNIPNIIVKNSAHGEFLYTNKTHYDFENDVLNINDFNIINNLNVEI